MTTLVLLESEGETALGRLLDVLGVVFERRSPAGALEGPDSGAKALILSEAHLAKARVGSETPAAFLEKLSTRYRYVLVYPFRGTPEGLRALSACVKAPLHTDSVGPTGGPYVVATGFDAAGPFRGLGVTVADTRHDRQVRVNGSPYPVDDVISARNGGLLVRIGLPGSEVFVLGCSAAFDVDVERTTNLETEQCFSELVPLLLFLRHAGVAFWRGAHPSACVIIDDLNLRPRYGFVDARTLARQVEELGCAVSIGFIPWNWNRTSASVAELFRSHWPRLSLCVHGCDHVGSEFSTSSAVASLPMIGLSLDRMRALSALTGVSYDRVMVFPQGRFSAPAMQALRQSDYLAAVNTELVDVRAQRGVPAGELLKPAITSYAGFPLLLRRKLDAPRADFALDLLLGKPCLVVTHHDDFQGGMEPFASLVRALNALEPAIRWTNLEAIVSGTYSTRRTTTGSVDVRLVASSTVVAAADAGSADTVNFTKVEPLVDEALKILVDGQEVPVSRAGDEIVFSVPRLVSATAVDVRMSSPKPRPVAPRHLRYRARVAARRYLSEFRDNYVARSSWAKAAVRALRGSPLPVTGR